MTGKFGLKSKKPSDQLSEGFKILVTGQVYLAEKEVFEGPDLLQSNHLRHDRQIRSITQKTFRQLI